MLHRGRDGSKNGSNGLVFVFVLFNSYNHINFTIQTRNSEHLISVSTSEATSNSTNIIS